MIVSAKFSESGRAASAITAAKSAGVAPGRIDVYSGKPAEFETGVLDRPSRMSLFAVLGGIAGCVGSTAFMFYAQRDYPLVTGGMPLNSLWATGVITFEATMAGAILATAATFLKESGLSLRRPALAAPVVRGDEVVVQVSCGAVEADAVESLMREAGAGRVERTEERP